jgi:hypothetical protein
MCVLCLCRSRRNAHKEGIGAGIALGGERLVAAVICAVDKCIVHRVFQLTSLSAVRRTNFSDTLTHKSESERIRTRKVV